MLVVSRWPLLLVVLAAALGFAAAPALADTHTQSFDYPVSLQPFEVQQQNALQQPRIDGAITSMSVDVVNPDGSPVPINRLMLHHIVFSKLGVTQPGCDTITDFDNKTVYPGLVERFYAAGEERQVLALPPGYGYRVSKDDNWLMTWMLMNHRARSDNAIIRYTVTWDDSPDVKPVKPLWLDVENCRADPVYDVAGGGRAGSVDRRTYDLTMPESGRILAGGGHLHGGGKGIEISQPACDNREVFTSRPAWGMPDHPFYTVRPILHEPGPISMSGYLSSQGFPVQAGQRLRLTSVYDDTRPHTRVMGIAMVYYAPGDVPEACAPAPTDAQNVQPADLRGQRYRTETPKFTVPLTGVNGKGRPVSISRPPGATKSVRSGTTLRVRDFTLGGANLRVPRGGRLTWAFGPSTLHNVTLANGPRGFSSPNLSDGRSFGVRFKVPGTYRLFCTLHPVAMTQTVTVR